MDEEFDESVHGPLINEFRRRLGDKVRPIHDNRALFKWLKARKFDIQAAEAMYLKSMQWRRDFGADTILTDYTEPEVIRKYYPGALFGSACDGSPVWIELMGRGDFRGILSSVSREDIVRSMVHRVETLHAKFRELSLQHQKPIDRCVHIIDVEGFEIKHLWKPILDMYIAILRMLEANYPETLRASYVINSPKFFKIGFDFLKHFIDPQTANKIVVLGEDYQQTLLNLIDSDELPAAYGGTKVDENGDPMCGQWICSGGEVPKHYYIRHQNSLFPDGKPLTKETLGRRRTVTVDVHVKKPLSELRWALQVDSGYVELAVKRRPGDPGELVRGQGNSPRGDGDGTVEEVVKPTTRCDSDSGIICGSVACDSCGQYFLEFYNPSLMYARSLTYCVEIIEPTIGADCATAPNQTSSDASVASATGFSDSTGLVEEKF